MKSIFQLLMLIPTTVIVLGWVWIAIKCGDKYEEIIDTLDPKVYKMPELFFVGFQIMELIHFNMKSDYNRKKVKEMSEIYGKQFAEYYYYIMVGAQISYAVTVLPIGCLLAILSNDSMALVYGIIIAVLLVLYMAEDFRLKLAARREELLLELPQAVSKMVLLINSGMILREAWHRVADGGNGILYVEMQNTSMEIQNGVSEWEAYQNFGERCALKEVKKFASLVTQGLQKGSSELAVQLKEMSDEIWEMKKNLVKRKGEAAKGKLLVPTVLIFVGILIMIIVPLVGGL